MSSTLSIDNFGSLNILERTKLNAAVLTGATSVITENADGIATDAFVVIGATGSEKAEVSKVASVAAQTLTLTDALEFDHERFDDVTKLYGDKIKIYRASNVNGSQPLDADFAAVVDGEIAIQADQLSTTFIDTTGSSDYWYKFTYLNSVASTETSLADSNAARGNGYGDYTSVQSIRVAAGFEHNRNVVDSRIDEHRQAAQAEINGKLAARYTVPFTAPINAFIADITKRLAAGYLWLALHNSAYSPTGTDKGSLMVKSAKDDITAIQNGSMTLIGTTGTEQDSGTGNGGFNGWPNNDTSEADGDAGGGERLFRISSTQGFSSRKY